MAITDNEAERKKSVRRLLTVLPDATLESLREACRSADYTHVHLLAHGASFRDAGNDRYGVALLGGSGDGSYTVVDGERLAIALMGRDASGRCKPPPTVVTLATCDSGNVSTVLVPGGSIAHELHTHGVPWVVASQFPLWMRASTLAAEVLYAGLLGGDDPRWVLHHLRQRLRAELPETHDWASIVAYASIPSDLEAQVHRFRDQQVRKLLDVRFERIDDLVGANRSEADAPALSEDDKAELQAQRDAIRAALSAWIGELTPANTAAQHAERLGVRGASEKRIAIAFALAGEAADSRNAYERALAAYLEAQRADPLNHWVLTQLLSIAVLPTVDRDGTANAAAYRNWWLAARQVAQWQLQTAQGTARVWAQGTLAELELLGAVYDPGFDAAMARATIVALCRDIRLATADDAFERLSTLRQFRRYARYWPREAWNGCVAGAIDALEDTEVLLLAKKDQEQLYLDIPKFERFFRIITENSLVSSRQRVLDNLSLTARQRYEAFCTRYPTLINCLPQKQIAAYIGVTPEFLSKMRANW